MIDKNIKSLSIQTQDKCTLFIELCKQAWYYIYISETLRSQQRHRELICQWRTVQQALNMWVPLPIANKFANPRISQITRVSRSLHQDGIAFDIYFDAIRHGKAYPNKSSGIYKSVWDIGKKCWLDRGGNWTVRDCPHFQDNGKKLDNKAYNGMKYKCANTVWLPILDDLNSQINYIQSLPQNNQISETIQLINNAKIVNWVKTITL